MYGTTKVQRVYRFYRENDELVLTVPGNIFAEMPGHWIEQAQKLGALAREVMWDDPDAVLAFNVPYQESRDLCLSASVT